MEDNNNLRHLQSMLLAIARLEEFTQEHPIEEAMEDYRISDVILLEFKNLANAASRLDSNFKVAHNDIPFNQMAAIRNRIAHDYLSVSLETLYQTIEDNIGEFKKLLLSIIEEEAIK